MRLIFIYGPPASGKLTIAETLSQKINVPLFHNHLTRDLVKDIYKEKLDSHYDLVDQLRFDVINYCAKNDTDLIFTYVYEGEDDDSNVRQFIKIIEDNKSEIFFIELVASRADLIARVDSDSRSRFQKLTDRTIMSSITEYLDKFTIPFVDATRINTSQFTPQESVERIIEELKRY